MKKIITVREGNIIKEKEVNYIPRRFIIAVFLILLETIEIIIVTMLCAAFIPYFYLALYITEVSCILAVINSDDNPDYKIPWLILILTVPVVGFMLYFLFYNRKLSKKYSKRMKCIAKEQIKKDNDTLLDEVKEKDRKAYLNMRLLCKLASTNIYKNTNATYFEEGIKMYEAMLKDLKQAKRFIFLEYFIIEEGEFWNSILEILKEKVKEQVEVRVIYDDIGCMATLAGNYDKILLENGIKAVPFSKLKGQANNEFNNRSHRKIMVIDGIIGYTGGVNIADEYINKIEKYGHWKDGGIRIEGDATSQRTELFLSDYEMNVKSPVESFRPYLIEKTKIKDNGYMIPFGDGPGPIYKYRIKDYDYDYAKYGREICLYDKSLFNY